MLTACPLGCEKPEHRDEVVGHSIETHPKRIRACLLQMSPVTASRPLSTQQEVAPLLSWEMVWSSHNHPAADCRKSGSFISQGSWLDQHHVVKHWRPDRDVLELGDAVDGARHGPQLVICVSSPRSGPLGSAVGTVWSICS